MHRNQKINVNVSRTLVALLVIIYSMMAFALQLLWQSPGVYLGAPGAGLAACALYHGYFYLGAGRVTAFRMGDNEIELFRREKRFTATMTRRHYESGRLIVLSLKEHIPGALGGLVLFSDALDRDHYRRLRVLLRFPV